MNQTKDILSAVLDTVAAHKEFIREVYTQGHITRTGENSRAILKLHQHRILVTEGRDRYRLSRFLVKFLDEVTQKQRLYELLGENIGGQVQRVLQLMTEYDKAIVETHTDYVDSVAAQFHDACADLSDTISAGISKLLDQAENNFAAVDTIAAKQRQNSHYITQAENISKALISLAEFRIQQSLDTGSAYYEALAPSYRMLIFDRMSEWYSGLVQVTAILKAYLFKLRMIEPDVKRLRQFATYLRQNPDYNPPDFDKNRRVPVWLMRDTGIVPKSFPDLLNMEMREDLASIARNLPAPKVSPRQKKVAGILERKAEDKQDIKITPTPYRSSLYKFGVAATKAAEPISAVKWKREYCSDLELPDELWILLVMHSQDLDRWPYNRLTYRRTEHRGGSPISKNLYIQDVRVYGR